MTTDTQSTKPSRLAHFGSSLILGFLVTALSVFAAATNYATYQVSGTGAGYETEGQRLLADSNTEYILATQYIIVDYDMYDGYIVNDGVDDFAAQYYQENFSEDLQDSIDRGDAFDDEYYEEMYDYSEELFAEAFDQFDLADAEGEREAGYQLAMLISAVGLAFAAYASLLDEKKSLRGLFALLSLVMLVLSVGQAALVAFS
jgi:hypothetical protein